MARPKLSEQRERYTIRFLSAELQSIQENASAAGITVSEYIRKRVLNRPVRSRVNVQIIGQLSRLGGLQKHLLMQIKGHPEEKTLREQLNATLSELHSTLRVIASASKE